MDLDPSNENMFLPVNQIYLGPALHSMFQKEQYNNGNLIVYVKTRCQIFLVEICKQIKQRFNFRSKIYYLIYFLAPKKFRKNTRLIIPSLIDLVNSIKRLNVSDTNNLDNEWMRLDCITISDNIKAITKDANEFYK